MLILTFYSFGSNTTVEILMSWWEETSLQEKALSVSNCMTSELVWHF